MNEWGAAEFQRLQTHWPKLQYQPQDDWVMFPDYPLPDGWNRSHVDLAVRIPAGLPAEAPYGFWVRGGLLLKNDSIPTNYTYPSIGVPFDPAASWGQFSWCLEPWAPGSEPGKGTGMVHFVDSIQRRLEELN